MAASGKLTMERASVKRAARAADASSIASGQKTVAQIRAANSLFANARSVTLDLGNYKRPR
jgi:hypothetical protein